MYSGYFSIYFIILSLAIVLCYHVFIPYLKKLKFGQNVRSDGPRTHYKKNGTPTMGGILILVTFLITFLSLIIVMKIKFDLSVILGDLILLIIPLFGYSFIGFLDDYLIILKKNNDGLKPKHKLLLELLISLIFYTIYIFMGYDTSVNIFTNEVDLKFLFGPLIILMFVSTTNSTNLTDGLDGLLTVSTIPVIIGFLTLGIVKNNYIVILSSIAMLIALLSFLFFNFPKATIFMGDTGSLLIGAYVCVCSILLKTELLLLVFGFVYILETLSVILQVSYFKITKGKRLFKMTPIHHHLELSGLSDIKINLIFFFLSTLFVMIGLLWELIIK